MLWTKGYSLYYPEAKKNLNISNIKFIQVEDGFICVCDTGVRMPFIFKINDEGNIVWGKLLSNIDSGLPNDIFPSVDNGAYITLTNGYSTIGMTVIKVSEKGEIKWAKNYGGTYISHVLNLGSDAIFYSGNSFVSLVNANGNANFEDNNRKLFIGEPISNINTAQIEIKTINGTEQGIVDYNYNTTKCLDISKYFIVKTDFSDNYVISIKPEIQVEKQNINLGSIKLNSSQTITLNILNNGLGELIIDDIAITGVSGSELKLKNNITSIKAKQKAQLSIIVSPKSSGTKKAILNIKSNDPFKNNLQLQLIYNAINPSGVININQNSINFGTVSIGQTYKKSVTITNLGISNLKISTVTIGGTDTDEFSFEANKVANKILKPKNKLTFNVFLKLKTKGSKSAYIIINSNDANKKARITLNAQVK